MRTEVNRDRECAGKGGGSEAESDDGIRDGVYLKSKRGQKGIESNEHCTARRLPLQNCGQYVQF
eukprot:3260213-Rhodomonas_salina.6